MIGYFALLHLLLSIQARPNRDYDFQVLFPEENDASFTSNDFFEEFSLEENDANLNKGFNLNKFRREQLDLHNYYRSLHGVPMMRMDRTLTAQAQEYAEELATENNGLKHCKPPHCDRHGAGENLASAWGSTTAETNATKAWYDEIWDYDFCSEGKTRPGHEGKATGHFTQVVWKASTKLGIGYARTRDRKGVFVVGRYLVHGNFGGQYKKNVPTPEYILEYFSNNCRGTNGGFSQWSETKCSRGCGGGIPIKTRTCTEPKPSLNGRDCRGKTKQVAAYEWCNTKGCSGEKSYRDSQCEARGKAGKANTYGGSSQCKLYCENLLAGKVEDGTHCNSDSGVCVDGVCKKMPHYVDPSLVSASGQVIGEFTKKPSSNMFKSIFFTVPPGVTNVVVKNNNYEGVRIAVGYKTDSGSIGYNWAEGGWMSQNLPYTKNLNVKGVPFTYKRTAKSSTILFEGPVRTRGFSVVLFALGNTRANISWKYTPSTVA